ncbi:MAG: hypothetical protein ABJB12_13495 [Pseudomonadota bacterium]
MSRLPRRHWIFAAAALLAALVVLQLWPRDETRITSLLQGLCAQLNETRDPATLAQLRAVLASSLLPDASVRVTELNEDAESRAEVQQRAGLLLSGGVPLSFALSSVEVHLSGALARADFDLLVMPRGSGEQRRELRHSRVRLHKGDGEWRIEAIEVDPVADSPPEARP